MIEEKHLENFQIKELKKNPNPYPQPENKNLPRLYPVIGLIGSRGSGKTYALIKLLKEYIASGIYTPDGKKQKIRVILISPTYDANQHMWDQLGDTLDHEDIHDTYSHDLMAELTENIRERAEEVEEYHELLKAIKKFKKARSDRDLSIEDIVLLEKHDFPEKLDDIEEPRDGVNGCCNFLILDDMVGDQAFSQSRVNPFLKFCIKNRHCHTVVAYCVQALKSIPRTLRLNTSVFYIFRQNSPKALDDFHEEVGTHITPEGLHELADHCHKEDHTPLIVDFTNKHSMFRKNLDTALIQSKDENAQS